MATFRNEIVEYLLVDLEAEKGERATEGEIKAVVEAVDAAIGDLIYFWKQNYFTENYGNGPKKLSEMANEV